MSDIIFHLCERDICPDLDLPLLRLLEDPTWQWCDDESDDDNEYCDVVCVYNDDNSSDDGSEPFAQDSGLLRKEGDVVIG